MLCDAVGDTLGAVLGDAVGDTLGVVRVGHLVKVRVGLLEREGRWLIVAAGGKTELLDGAIEGLTLGLAIGLHEG